jgi:hypothetical protein
VVAQGRDPGTRGFGLAYGMVGDIDADKRQIRRGWATTYVYDDYPFIRYVDYLHERIEAKYEGRDVWGRCEGTSTRPPTSTGRSVDTAMYPA